MVKVCHITSAHKRYDVRIFEKECRSLAKNGYDVTLIVNDSNEDEVIDNVKIVSTKFAPISRKERMLKSGNKILEKAVEVDADVYHFHDPELLPIGNRLKKIGKKVIFDSHEDVPMQIMDKYWIPKYMRRFASKSYRIYEDRSVRKYDAVISVTPHLVERFKLINSNCAMVTNYPIINIVEETSKNPKKAICFAGGISEQWSHHNIINAIEDIPELEYILAGEGEKEYMDSLKSLPGWRKVNYLGKIPHSDVRYIYYESIAGVALNFSNQAKEQGTLGNTKLFEFMESGLPVICSDYKLWKEIINEYECGICVNPNDVAEIKNAVDFVINNVDKSVKMGQNARKAAVEKYNWSTQEGTLLETYKNLINNSIF